MLSWNWRKWFNRPRHDPTVTILVRVRRMDDTMDDVITTATESAVHEFFYKHVNDVDVREVWIFKQIYHADTDDYAATPLLVAAASGMHTV